VREDDTHPETAELLNDAAMRNGLSDHWRESYVWEAGKSMKAVKAVWMAVSQAGWRNIDSLSLTAYTLGYGEFPDDALIDRSRNADRPIGPLFRLPRFVDFFFSRSTLSLASDTRLSFSYVERLLW
jgi:hypothetical protein